MRILLQGGWKPGQNEPASKELVENYYRRLACHLVQSNHAIVLTGTGDFDQLVANGVAEHTKTKGKGVKDYLIYLLPEREQEIPRIGRVIRIPQAAWWIEERTYCVQQSDAVLAIGGGKGTLDCVEKGFLSRKPVFVASAIPSPAVRVWAARRGEYKYRSAGDTSVFDDLNVTPDQFFQNMFEVLDKILAAEYSRRVFIVHGRNHHRRDTLAEVLRKLKFEPVILEEEGNRSLTVIEKLERSMGGIGFAFILYAPDDFGGLDGMTPQPRARQNVVFEHGLLIGLLGRDRTCALVQTDIEAPSDINGMLFEHVNDIRLESLRIAKVLKQAGYDVDVSGLL